MDNIATPSGLTISRYFLIMTMSMTTTMSILSFLFSREDDVQGFNDENKHRKNNHPIYNSTFSSSMHILFLRADDVQGFNALREQKQKQKNYPIYNSCTTSKYNILFFRADEVRGFSDDLLDSWEKEEEGEKSNQLFNFR